MLVNTRPLRALVFSTHLPIPNIHMGYMYIYSLQQSLLYLVAQRSRSERQLQKLYFG